ncbi:MAG: TOBE domain-containing protein [Burkholderiaceae bacterium]
MVSPRPRAAALAGALGQPAADKRIEILRLVAGGGSISQAARDAGVSYKAAWQAIDTLTNLAGVAVVEKVVGGTGGGGARVTAAGRDLLEAAQRMAAARRQAAAGPVIEQMALRTSMRNQVPCLVAGLEGEGRVVDAGLQFAGARLVSRVTRESAELLSLAPGQRVLAMFKATAVEVIPAGAKRPAARGANLLEGRAHRVDRDATGDEVAVEVAPGVRVVGFAAAGSGIRVRSRVFVRIERSAVVIGWAG